MDEGSIGWIGRRTGRDGRETIDRKSIVGATSRKLDMSAHAVPITYAGASGKQYVAIVAAGRSALDDDAPEGTDALVGVRAALIGQV